MADSAYGIPASTAGGETLDLIGPGSRAGKWEPATPVDSAGTEIFPTLTGTYGYDAGTAKTINVPTGARCLSIACHATSAGTLTIAGGASIPIPAATGFSATPGGSLVGPAAIVATGTDSVFVDWIA